MPMEEYNGKKLNFPIGIGDVALVTGKKVSIENFRSLPQFWFMGENDRNDAVKFDDGYNPTERKLIFDILGEEMMPNRWEKIQQIYRYHNIPAHFKTYKGIGHGLDLDINNEVSAFFKQNMK
jgi:hypothetical protein